MNVNAIVVCLLLGAVQEYAMDTHVDKMGELHGYLNTPNYPKNYSKNYEGIWELDLPVIDQPYTLVLTIEAMDIEGSSPHCFDYIKVIHKKYCGTSPMTIRVPDVVGGLIIDFHSDNSETRKGFKAHYEFVKQ
ncbi:dorsal-ventral patterning tolloid-like protein 1 [Haliotis rubra]|uniref:dorsal-ventral patterning tolloid-like protein 1 n=1 Tax=Haliotis rubra TaxID=36100 RepID=UPI001EE4F0A6|nr:dorsal-ventral patterning tolloid-like protein 1 [Haliotis rubra]